jgi:predicted dinucleotide-binding enzyme
VETQIDCEGRDHRHGEDGQGVRDGPSTHPRRDRGLSDPTRADRTATATGASRGAIYADAATNAEVVILTVPWKAFEETLAQLGDLKGNVVIDVSFPYKKSEREALKGSSTAEEIQKRLPRARVLKGGWNHAHACD